MAKSEKPEHARRRGRNGGGQPHAPGAHKRRKNQPKRSRNGATNQHTGGELQECTEKHWQGYLAHVANGATHADAATAVNLTTQTVDAFLISNVAAAGQLRDAKILRDRREWPLEQIEEFLAEIAMGATRAQAFAKLGIEPKRAGSLYRLLLQDKALRKWYDEARELQAESYSDDIIDIADETSNDWTENKDGKEVPNHEVINRSRLRVDARKWLSGKWAPKRFGDNKHHIHEGELNINHAAALSGGRKRVEALHAKRKGIVIDNDTQEVVEGNA